MITEVIAPEIKKEFKPITVQITLETEEDARLMYHVLNRGNLTEVLWDYKDASGRNSYGEGYVRPGVRGFMCGGYSLLSKELRNQGIKI